jgi:hypothetical protein
MTFGESMEEIDTLTLQAFESSDLTPIVSQVIDQPKIDSLDWQVTPVSGMGGGKASGAVGLYRLNGIAEAGGSSYPWSVIVKSFIRTSLAEAGRDTIQDPASWNYWAREKLAYQSGILNDLGGNLVAPRFFGVTETPNGESWVWLQDVQETVKTWSMSRYGLAARHLGQFNGTYLVNRDLPEEQPWMYPGRTAEWVKVAEAMFPDLRQYAETASGQRWLSRQTLKRMQMLFPKVPSLIAFLDRLPICLCHHDAFRRNLLAQDLPGEDPKTFAVDWSMFGYGGVGQETGITTAISLVWMEFDGSQAKELDQLIFESYLDGLRDVGWQGDIRLARFGYTATAALSMGLSWLTFMGTALSSDEGVRGIESDFDYPIDDIFAQWASVLPFLLDLSDEALQLMVEIG